MVNMFMIKEIRLYKDKIVQRFRLSNSERVIYLNNAKYSSRTAFYLAVMVISNIDVKWKRIVFDPRLIGTGEKKEFYKVLSELSGRSIAELKNTYPTEKLIKQ